MTFGSKQKILKFLKKRNNFVRRNATETDSAWWSKNITLLCDIYFLSWIWHLHCLLFNGLKLVETPIFVTHSILNKTIIIRRFCFWMNFIIARNFKISFTFQSYVESVLVLWKKVTILSYFWWLHSWEKARFSIQDTTFREWHNYLFQYGWAILVQKFWISSKHWFVKS